MSTEPENPGQPSELKTLVLQFVLYLFVGGLSSVVDIGGFAVMVAFGTPLVLASTVSFIIATVVNYFLSYVLAFTRGRYSQRSEVLRFWLVSLVGLLINTLIVWLVVQVFGAQPIWGKIVALPIVLVWNFVGRRLFVFSKDLPPAAVAIVSRRSKA